MSEALSRREFVRRSGGALLLTFLVGGCEEKMTPGEATQKLVPLRTLTLGEESILGTLGEALVPGASAAGIVQYVDHQLSGPAVESMLMIKYLGVPSPFTGFYRGGLAAVEAASRKKFGKEFGLLSEPQVKEFVADLSAGKLPDWSGPPQPFFYFVVRSDAIDVTYGTVEGFASLEVPYMPHIAPATHWGA